MSGVGQTAPPLERPEPIQGVSEMEVKSETVVVRMSVYFSGRRTFIVDAIVQCMR